MLSLRAEHPERRKGGKKGRTDMAKKKEIICAFGTDIDSVAGWIGSYGGVAVRWKFDACVASVPTMNV